MEILHLTKNDFNNTINSGTVLVDFWASWCMPCKMLAPVIEEIADELGDGIKTAKVDVDAEGMLALEYGVMSIPTVILFKDGQEFKRFVGVQPKDVYLEVLAPQNTGIITQTAVDLYDDTIVKPNGPELEATNEGVEE